MWRSYTYGIKAALYGGGETWFPTMTEGLQENGMEPSILSNAGSEIPIYYWKCSQL